jgi:hypothetical protein
LQGLSLHGSKIKLFQKRNKTPINAWAKAFAEVKSNCFKKETKPQEMHGLSLHGSEAKLFQKRNKTPRNARAKPSRKQNQIV